jgi:para-nitrobenzyl esterase
MRSAFAIGAWIVIAVVGCSGGDAGGGDLAAGGDADAPVEVMADVTADVEPDTGAEVPVDSVVESVEPAPLEVEVESGRVRGIATGGARAFLGIPYAAPPVGDLRWRPPASAAAWDGTLDASQWGAGCPQDESPMTEAPSLSEDCLTLNVWAPPAGTGHPVIAFVHGGGFQTGASASSYTVGTHLAVAGGVVVVSMNYRLGTLGFLAHPALTAEDPAHPASGGYGIEDQRAALAWVQRNVAAFGGDPGNVTLMGQSAGGISVCLHLVSPASEGLFHRAILESGPCLADLPTLAEAEAQGEALAVAVGCDSEADVLACLRGKPVAELRAALTLKQGFFFGEGAIWEPVVDGTGLPGQPAARLASGDFHHVPVLAGSNGDEGSLLRFLAFPGGVDAAEYEAFVEKVFGALADQALARYPAASFASPTAALDALLGEFVFVCPVRRTLRSLAAAGVPVHAYRFLHAPGFLPLPGFAAYHTAELAFVFRALPEWQSFTAEQEALSLSMSARWASFATVGNPADPGSAVAWPAYDGSDDRHLVLDLDVTTATGYVADACDFWDAFPVRP